MSRVRASEGGSMQPVFCCGGVRGQFGSKWGKLGDVSKCPAAKASIFFVLQVPKTIFSGDGDSCIKKTRAR